MFNPKLPTFRAMRACAAVFFAVIGMARLLTASHFGNTRNGWWLLAIAFAFLLGVLPEPQFAAKKPEPEKYPLTGSKP